MTLLAFGFGNPMEIAIIGGLILLLFGGSKLAGFGKSLGEGIKEFKKATTEEEAPVAPPPPAPVAVVPPPPVGPTEEK